MKVNVIVYASHLHMMQRPASPFREYVMDHDSPEQRRVLGEQCRNAFEGGQCVVTFPVSK